MIAQQNHLLLPVHSDFPMSAVKWLLNDLHKNIFPTSAYKAPFFTVQKQRSVLLVLNLKLIIISVLCSCFSYFLIHYIIGTGDCEAL